MVRRRQCGSGLVLAVIVLIVVIVVGGLAWNWYSTQGTPYVFSPCPGLTVTSRVTTGIWNCPNQPVPSGSSRTFTAGQFVTITGTWATGYGTVGCVPQSGQSSCAVPQIASLQDYLHANIGGGMWFVVQWKQGAAVQLMDGQRVTVSGTLKAITYPSSPGATFPIYHLNNQTGGSDLLQPQPSFEITDAVLI
jgi:hypothetical protein